MTQLSNKALKQHVYSRESEPLTRADLAAILDDLVDRLQEWQKKCERDERHDAALALLFLREALKGTTPKDHGA